MTNEQIQKDYRDILEALEALQSECRHQHENGENARQYSHQAFAQTVFKCSICGHELKVLI